jgi:hypothetical protein
MCYLSMWVLHTFEPPVARNVTEISKTCVKIKRVFERKFLRLSVADVSLQGECLDLVLNEKN